MIKQEECEVFREFCRLSGQNPADYDHPDRPDFVRKDGKVGVELEAYHRDLQATRGSAEQEAEEAKKSLASRAREQFLQQATQRMNVVLYMQCKANIHPMERRAGEIADLVVKHSR